MTVARSWLEPAAVDRMVTSAICLFTWESPAFEGKLGACHGLEIPFVSGGVRRPLVAALAGGGAAAEALSKTMRDAWTAWPSQC